MNAKRFYHPPMRHQVVDRNGKPCQPDGSPLPKRRLEVVPAPVVEPPPVFAGASPCCAKAVRVPCVCIASWKCPVHGSHCFGSHE